jgi:phosphonopyruvate decarboxylase
MIDTKQFYDYLNKNSLDFYAGVPDSLLKNLCACITENAPSEKNIITANEGNAVAMCAGYHLSTGKYGVVYMQNSGEGNAVNPLMSLTDPEVYSIPLLLIIGWRGEPGVHDEPQHVKQGKVTIPLLEAMGISYEILDDNYETKIDVAISHMKKENAPFALIVKKGLFSPYKLVLEKSTYMLSREDSLKEILSDLTDEDIIVSTTGKTSREIFEIRESRKQGHSNDFLTVGSMGHTASIAYGVALGTKKNVWCVDGDGSFIMHMGGLGVIGSKMLPNFKYILNVNNAHESVGGQPTCSKFLNIPEILHGLGFKEVFIAENQQQIKEGIKELRDHSGYALILHTKQGSRDDLGRPTTTPQENKKALMKKLGSL